MNFREFAVLYKNGAFGLSDLSKKIIEFQKKNNLRSVRAIANGSGVPVSTLYDVLKERTNNLSVDNSQKLADFMGISVDELYGKEKAPVAVAPTTRDSKYEVIYDLFYNLSEEKMRLAVTGLQYLVSIPEDQLPEAVRYLKYLAESKGN